MNDIVRVNESIEGQSVGGSSRKPLIDRGLCSYKGGNYYRYTASFNVRSGIVSELPEGIKKIDETACFDSDNELICERAIVHSVTDKFASSVKSNVSSSHGSNFWLFSKQTNVKIVHAHQEILNAIKKSELKLIAK